MSLAIDYAAQLALDEETIPNTELARLLYHRLQTEEGQETARQRRFTVTVPYVDPLGRKSAKNGIKPQK